MDAHVACEFVHLPSIEFPYSAEDLEGAQVEKCGCILRGSTVTRNAKALLFLRNPYQKPCLKTALKTQTASAFLWYWFCLESIVVRKLLLPIFLLQFHDL